MSKRKPEDEPSTSRMEGRRKIDEEEEQQQPNVMAEEALNQLAIAAVPNEEDDEMHPKIFKLDDDCVQEMFNWLSIKDIHSVSETCTRMQRIAGDYFQPNLSALNLSYDGEFNMDYPDASNLTGFKEIIQELGFTQRINDEGYRFIGLHCKSLKRIYLYMSELDAIKIEHIKPILSKVESIMFGSNNIRGEFYESFLQFCPKLKYLNIARAYGNGTIGTSYEWFHRSYPTMEHLELGHVKQYIPELGQFFELNPQLQKFSANGHIIIDTMNEILASKIKLQTLAIYLNYGHVLRERAPLLCGQLNQLHEQGFYQRLHLRIDRYWPQTIEILSLRGLEELYLNLGAKSKKLNLSALINLRELGIISDTSQQSLIELQSTAKSLVNLERLYFGRIKSEMIVPFVQYSAKLKAIKIKKFDGGNIIDLSEWDKKREKLVGARKVNIYLEEDAFLATKWNCKATNLKLIELKRAQSLDWNIPFSH